MKWIIKIVLTVAAIAADIWLFLQVNNWFMGKIPEGEYQGILEIVITIGHIIVLGSLYVIPLYLLLPLIFLIGED